MDCWTHLQLVLQQILSLAALFFCLLVLQLDVFLKNPPLVGNL